MRKREKVCVIFLAKSELMTMMKYLVINAAALRVGNVPLG